MRNALAISAASIPLPQSKGKSKKVEDDDNRGESTRLVIEFTENGFNTCVSFEPETIDPKLDRYSQTPEDEEMSFGGKSALDEGVPYITAMIQKHLGYEAAEDKGAGKAKSAPTAEAE